MKRQTAIKIMYKHQKKGSKDWFSNRELTRLKKKKVPDSNDIARTKMTLRRLRDRGFVETDENNGQKYHYRLTEQGMETGKMLTETDYYCPHCSEFKDKVVKKPSCPDCGTGVERREH